MSHAHQSIDVGAPLEVAFRVISDFQRYPEFLNHIRSVQVESAGTGEAVVSFSLNVIKPVAYTIRAVAHAPDRLSWTLIRGDNMAENTGEWKLTPLPDGKTHIDYDIVLKLSALVPHAITTMLAGQFLPEMLEMFKRRIETSVSA